VTQNVPYLGAISGALNEILKIKDVRGLDTVVGQKQNLQFLQEVDTCKEDWKIILRDVEEIKKVIDGYLVRISTDPAYKLPDSICEACTSLERYISL
jgi:hypothetical protein